MSQKGCCSCRVLCFPPFWEKELVVIIARIQQPPPSHCSDTAASSSSSSRVQARHRRSSSLGEVRRAGGRAALLPRHQAKEARASHCSSWQRNGSAPVTAPALEGAACPVPFQSSRASCEEGCGVLVSRCPLLGLPRFPLRPSLLPSRLWRADL